MQSKEWKFNPLKDRVLKTGGDLVPIVLLGVAASMVTFAPAAVVLAAMSGLRFLAISAYVNLRSVTEKNCEEKVRDGRYKVVTEDKPMGQVVAEISRKLGVSPPKVYAGDGSKVGVMAALPKANIVVVGEEEAARLGKAGVRFGLAHEISHLQVDGFIPEITNRAIQNAIGALFYCSAISMGLALTGVALPVLGGTTFMTLATLLGINKIIDLSTSFSSRVKERRADRNALYITRDFEGAEELLKDVTPPEQQKKISIFVQMFHGHPTFQRRVESLRKSFNIVSQYPELKAVNNNTAPLQQQGKKYAVSPSSKM